MSPPAFPDDWSGEMARTFSLPNNVVAVADAADAVTVRLHDGTTYVLRAADVGPVAPGADAREAVSEAVYRTCLAHQRTPAR